MPGSKASGLLPHRPDTKSLNKLWEQMSQTITKSPNLSSKALKAKNLKNPTAKKFRNSPPQPKISGWLSKPTSTLAPQKHRKDVREPLTPLKITQSKKTSQSLNKCSAYLERKNKSSKTLKRYNSGSSDELPTFKDKTIQKKQKQSETFKKYGVIVPSLDEIVADQTKFVTYKIQVEEAQALREPTFKMPFSPEKMNHLEEEGSLDCKHLPLTAITNYFNDDLPFLRDIINGKQFSDRHKRYLNKNLNKNNYLTANDLTYNTSTIVFTFEQLDHIISLMHTEFDPEEKETAYFFKVLIPELCLKIFMKTHNMNKRKAIKYLEIRPLE